MKLTLLACAGSIMGATCGQWQAKAKTRCFEKRKKTIHRHYLHSYTLAKFTFCIVGPNEYWVQRAAIPSFWARNTQQLTRNTLQQQQQPVLKGSLHRSCPSSSHWLMIESIPILGAPNVLLSQGPFTWPRGHSSQGRKQVDEGPSNHPEAETIDKHKNSWSSNHPHMYFLNLQSTQQPPKLNSVEKNRAMYHER